MTRYGFSILRMAKSDNRILRVEAFCFDRTTAADTCATLNTTKPEYHFAYQDTDITERMTEDEQQNQMDVFNQFVKMAETLWTFDDKRSVFEIARTRAVFTTTMGTNQEDAGCFNDHDLAMLDKIYNSCSDGEQQELKQIAPIVCAIIDAQKRRNS